MALTVGSRLGHYDVTALIGEGGMGQVYQATDTKLNRQVALKILPEAFAEDPDRIARFQREAQVLASLNHPNIAAIHGLEDSEGTKALVLELVEGPTLADRIAQGPIPVDEALPIAKQIAEALEAAHEQGVIHRDLKPANVKVKDDGTVKVLDFGLAKAMQPEGSDVSASMSPTISLTAAATQMGMVIGTAAYMAPEQASGKVVDKRADIWAFGAVLYEMLTGRRAFSGEDVSHTLAAVLMKEIDWSALSKDTPDMVRRLLRRSLERDPRKRMRDIGEARLELEDPQPVQTTVGTVVSPQLQVWQRPLPAAIAALGIAAIASVAVWSLTRPAPPRVASFSIPLAANQNFSSTGSAIVAISPDGSQVVHTANGSLWLRPVDQLQAVQVPGSDEGSFGPFFSADGQSIGYFAGAQLNAQLKKVAVSGGASVTLADVVRVPFGASWGADDMILYTQRDGIWQVPGAGGTPELLIAANEGELMHGAQMLPGGEWVLLTVRPAGQTSWDEGQIVVQSVTTNERTALIVGRDGRYLATGHLVYGLNNVLFAVPFDVGSREVTGGPVPLVEGVRQATNTVNAAMQFSVSTNGSLVYVPGAGGVDDIVTLTWVGRDGDEERISAPPRAYGRLRVSPDGSQVAVDITDGDNRDIWVWNLAEERLTQITFEEADDNYVLWTPDSARVVFASSREGGGLYWKAADGTGQVDKLMDGLARPHAWAADGRLIFDQAGGSGTDIGVLTMEGERTVEMLFEAEFTESEPSLSPDGRWLAYLSIEAGRRILVKPFPNIGDGLWNVTVDQEGVQPLWSPDGRELFYRNIESNLMVAQVETEPTFSSSTPEQLFDLSSYGLGFGPDLGRQFDIAPDGRFLLPTSGTAGQTSDDADFNGLIFVENWFEELKERVPVD